MHDAKQVTVERVRDDQEVVANRLRLQAADEGVRQQGILGIDRAGLLAGLRVEPPGTGREYGANQSLERPAIRLERPCEVIEQRRMRGRWTQVAEVVGCGSQAAAEEVVPDAVDDHPPCQRVVGPQEIVGEF